LVIETEADRKARKEHEVNANLEGLKAMLAKGARIDEEHQELVIPLEVLGVAEYRKREEAESIPVDIHRAGPPEVIESIPEKGSVGELVLETISKETGIEIQSIEQAKELVDTMKDGQILSDLKANEDAPVEVEEEPHIEGMDPEGKDLSDGGLDAIGENVTDTKILDEIEAQIARLEAMKESMRKNEE